MIDALIAGKIYGTPKSGIGKSGADYVNAMVRVATAGGDSLMCSVIAFDEAARNGLMALGNGDGVSLSGTLTPKVYRDKNGEYRPSADMLASAVLSPYQVKRKRQAAEGGNA
ncbi:MAG: single-stranded DNA-binding protein [Castellaniella sp.]|uniref:single-stranded DNA-binding protein n=1 Tax=Castellaniella sp. TaxID=1955812 RepID=UPI003C737393